MDIYRLGQALTVLEREPQAGEQVLVLLTSEELAKQPRVPGLEQTLIHMPPARDARTCKAEVRRDCLCGTVVTPRQGKEGAPVVFGFLLTRDRAALCDDSGAARAMLRRLAKDKRWQDNGPGRFFYEFLELLLEKELRHLESLEDRLSALEDRVSSGALEEFNAALSALRKEAMVRFRYYDQLDNLVCELEENEPGLFSPDDQHRFHLLEKRLSRLRNQAQLLREYCVQVRELFQAEIDIRQNRIMKILTIVTTVFLPLSLVAGWYGMNFVGMPELHWKYGYPVVIGVSVLIVVLCLWICKKKKFW